MSKTIELELTDEEIEGLRFWWRVVADFGDVQYETGVDLIEVLNRVAQIATEGA